MNSFKKEERLCSRKQLDLLFKNGSSFLLYPFRVSFLLTETLEEAPVQVVINVSKKRYKRAVDRNLIKRRIREVYRTNKSASLYTALTGLDKLVLLSLQYVGKDKYATDFLEKKLLLAFKKLTISIGDEGHK